MSRSALLLCLLAAVCGAQHLSLFTPEVEGRIVGGEPVDIKQFPWQVALEQILYDLPWHICGGSIISSTWVLTSAFCVDQKTPQELYVRAGTSFRETDGIVYNVANIIQHEDYDYSIDDYDFGLVEISESFAFGSNVQAVILGSSELVHGIKVNITGWGSTSQVRGRGGPLHAVTTSIVDHDTCNTIYAFLGGITERMICAGEEEGGKDACGGDAGGPLVAGNTQYGVYSWGWGCARPRYPSIYSNVPAVRSWITAKTGV